MADEYHWIMESFLENEEQRKSNQDFQTNSEPENNANEKINTEELSITLMAISAMRDDFPVPDLP